MPSSQLINFSRSPACLEPLAQILCLSLHTSCLLTSCPHFTHCHPSLPSLLSTRLCQVRLGLLLAWASPPLPGPLVGHELPSSEDDWLAEHLPIWGWVGVGHDLQSPSLEDDSRGRGTNHLTISQPRSP